MISSELRIGNCVSIKNHINLCKVVEIKEQTLRVEYFREDIKSLHKPIIEIERIQHIPLTEEWLLKFGFDFSVDTWYLNGVAIWETECCDAKGNEEIGFFYELREVGMMDMNIKYVHQLQNLYFALTGQELKIK